MQPVRRRQGESETEGEAERARAARRARAHAAARSPQVRQQGGERQHANSAAALIACARTEGARGLWRAAPLTVVRASAASAAQLTAYSLAKPLVARRVLGGAAATSPAAHALASVPAAVAYVLAAAPADAIRTRTLVYNEVRARAARPVRVRDPTSLRDRAVSPRA